MNCRYYVTHFFLILCVFRFRCQLLSSSKKRIEVIKSKPSLVVGTEGKLVLPIDANVLTSRNLGVNCKTLFGLRFNVAAKNHQQKKTKKAKRLKQDGRKYISFFRKIKG